MWYSWREMLFELSHENTGFEPAFPWEGEAIQSKTATCSFQTVQAKCFSKSQTAHPSSCRHQEYPKCPGGLAWAGWQGRWHIWVFVIWFLLLQMGLDEAEPNVRFLLIVGTKFNLSICCCSNRGGQIFTSHVCKIGKSWQSPKVCWALVPLLFWVIT